MDLGASYRNFSVKMVSQEIKLPHKRTSCVSQANNKATSGSNSSDKNGSNRTGPYWSRFIDELSRKRELI